MEEDDVELERRSRFAHLLKPIRDLADNWDIDIAGELVEYLEELDHLVIDFEDGDLNLNFAEAALLVQGSTAVYSNKVEFLYNLVFKTLDLLCEARVAGNAKGAEKEREAAKAKRRRKSVLNMGQEARDFFLLLDDEIPVGNNIDLGANGSAEDLGDDEEEDEEAGAERARQPTHQAKTDTGLRERIPFALVSARQGGSNETSGAFRMMTCQVDASGAFILEAPKKSDIQQARLAQEAGHGSSDNEDEREAFFDSNDTSYDEHGAAGLDLEQPQAADVAASPEEATQGHAHPASAMRTMTGALGALSQSEDPESSSWERLDPHDPGCDSSPCPLKVGMTWTTPRALQMAPEEQLQERFKQLLVPNLLVSVALQPDLAARIPRQRSDMVILPEFRPYSVLKRQRAREAGAKRGDRTTHRAKGALKDDDEAVEDQEEFVARLMVSGALGAEVKTTESGEDAAPQVAEGVFDNNQGYFDDGDAGAYFDEHDDDHVEQSGLGFGGLDLNPETFDKAEDSYVDMVKAHLQRYIESANQWVSETGLHARVRRWEDKIEPFLAEQNQRPAFDIHAYGSKILDGLDSKSNELHGAKAVSFEDLSARLAQMSLPETKAEDESDVDEETPGARDTPRILDKYEVCRFFLASLQLANNGNVELLHATNCSQLTVRLLDQVLANEKLDTAPFAHSVPSDPLPDKPRPKKRVKNQAEGIENVPLPC